MKRKSVSGRRTPRVQPRQPRTAPRLVRVRPRLVRLAPGCRLSGGSARRGRVLLCPAGAVQLNDLAAAVLALCDGRRTREEILARILSASRRGLSRNIREFLRAAYRHGWLVDSG